MKSKWREEPDRSMMTDRELLEDLADRVAILEEVMGDMAIGVIQQAQLLEELGIGG